MKYLLGYWFLFGMVYIMACNKERITNKTEVVQPVSNVIICKYGPAKCNYWIGYSSGYVDGSALSNRIIIGGTTDTSNIYVGYDVLKDGYFK